MFYLLAKECYGIFRFLLPVRLSSSFLQHSVRPHATEATT